MIIMTATLGELDLFHVFPLSNQFVAAYRLDFGP
jgi:hypothetical protein